MRLKAGNNRKNRHINVPANVFANCVTHITYTRRGPRDQCVLFYLKIILKLIGKFASDFSVKKMSWNALAFYLLLYWRNAGEIVFSIISYKLISHKSVCNAKPTLSSHTRFAFHFILSPLFFLFFLSF